MQKRLKAAERANLASKEEIEALSHDLERKAHETRD